MKYISIALFIAAPLFLVWSIGYWENQLSYFIFVLLLVLAIIFATRRPKDQGYTINPEDPDYQKRRAESEALSKKPIAILYSPVLWLGLFFVGLVIYIVLSRLFS